MKIILLHILNFTKVSDFQWNFQQFTTERWHFNVNFSQNLLFEAWIANFTSYGVIYGPNRRKPEIRLWRNEGRRKRGRR